MMTLIRSHGDTLLLLHAPSLLFSGSLYESGGNLAPTSGVSDVTLERLSLTGIFYVSAGGFLCFAVHHTSHARKFSTARRAIAIHKVRTFHVTQYRRYSKAGPVERASLVIVSVRSKHRQLQSSSINDNQSNNTNFLRTP